LYAPIIPAYDPRSYLLLQLRRFSEYTNLHFCEFWLPVSVVVGTGSSIFSCYRFSYQELPVFISFLFSTRFLFELWLIVNSLLATLVITIMSIFTSIAY